jgi:hypothetical protein
VRSCCGNIAGRRRRSQVDSAQTFELVEQFLESGNNAEFGVHQFFDFGVVPGVAAELVSNPEQSFFIEFLHDEKVFILLEVETEFTLISDHSQSLWLTIAVPKFLSRQQIELYQEQGFVAPIDVMDEEEADAYLQRLQVAEAEHPDQLNAENRNNAHLAFSFLDELVHHPGILAAVEDLICASFGMWGSVLFIKEPQSKHFVSWHQDATYMGLEPQNFVTPWLALTPSNLETG